MKTPLPAVVAAVLVLGIAAVCAAPPDAAGALVLANTIAAVPRLRRLTTRQLMEKLGIQSRETLRKLERNAGFPRPVYDEGSPVKFFLENEADEYIQRQVEARDRARDAKQPQEARA